MQTADLNHLELRDAWYQDDPAMRIRVNFPFYVATGNETLSLHF